MRFCNKIVQLLEIINHWQSTKHKYNVLFGLDLIYISMWWAKITGNFDNETKITVILVILFFQPLDRLFLQFGNCNSKNFCDSSVILVGFGRN